MNAHLLGANLTPDEYRTISPRKGLGFADDTSYWESLPVYLLARCPLCSGAYIASLDTYGLEHWQSPNEGLHVFNGTHQNIDCPHFVCTHYFISLNKVAPIELYFLSLWSEVPCVMPDFLTDDVESYGVMHALPICRYRHQNFAKLN
ncbi:MAG: hypothetical protein GY847_39290 [Proteobacteria bacterium]|nr:hypothetical protein [Pseudomonadota bacterium]